MKETRSQRQLRLHNNNMKAWRKAKQGIGSPKNHAFYYQEGNGKLRSYVSRCHFNWHDMTHDEHKARKVIGLTFRQ